MIRTARHFQLTLKADVDTIQGGHEVWVLLTRHVTDTKRHSEFISVYAEVGDLPDVDTTHLKVSLIHSSSPKAAKFIVGGVH